MAQGSGTRVVEAAAATLRAWVVDLDPDQLSVDDALALLGSLSRLANAVDAGKALVARRIEGSSAHDRSGHASTAHLLAEASGTTVARANELVETGRALRNHAATDAALRSGEVSVEQARHVAKAAAVDPSAEGDLLAVAAKESVQTLAKRAHDVRLAAEENREGRYRRQWAKRSLRHGTTEEGMVWGRFELPPDTGAAVVTALERRADREFDAASKAGRREQHDRYVADALVSLVTDTATTSTSRGAEVVVHVSHESLLRGSVASGETCEVQGAGPIPVEVAREIAQDAFLTGVLVDGEDVLKVKRFGRRRSAALRSALEVRTYLTEGDVRCSVEGCDRTLGLEWDHREPVARGGPTSYRNMQPLCRHHHRAKTRRDGRAPPAAA